ncbi:MAG TPA: sulfite exporter TauE/SafE family protein [Opitutaceae bacterium]|nr:sulfite exporter TauE/SafE family protein [Opitutaceae bacterium]
MNVTSIHSPETAFIAGVVTSLHCVGMCGPLACWLAPKSGQDSAPLFAVYQGSRLLSYTLLGATVGLLGFWPVSHFPTGLSAYLPWALVAYFVAVAFRLDKRLRKPMFAVRLGLRLQAWARGRSPFVLAAGLGAATPLLPCGPLYFVVTLAALSGSVSRGAEFMLAFGLGTLPLLWFAQAQFGRLRARLTPVSVQRLQSALALAAAGVIAWRLQMGSENIREHLSSWVCF